MDDRLNDSRAKNLKQNKCHVKIGNRRIKHALSIEYLSILGRMTYFVTRDMSSVHEFMSRGHKLLFSLDDMFIVAG